MFVFDLVGTENNPVYQIFEAQNLIRQYDFTHSLFQAGTALGIAGLSHAKLKAMNYHGIACLHQHAGEYRPHNVIITNANHKPPPFEQVPALMEQFVGEVNNAWGKLDPMTISAFVLWRLNWIHPFVNGNGRTARVAAYYAICRIYGLWMPGSTTVPELIRADRDAYYAALRAADDAHAAGISDVSALADLLGRLLSQQLASVLPPDVTN